ncbi:unnamed protein product [Angiostrongylus costaricensis]|uniref:Uncharacterized protein n=1 Tax=Angiostrongylus costaricensis TaxID=334426 RepID=A0A0R3PYH1_ANGCS|nr:unnamed protein product [Angiostrongylus costaricensis]
MLFLYWTFHSLEGSAGYDLKEAGNLPLVSYCFKCPLFELKSCRSYRIMSGK